MERTGNLRLCQCRHPKLAHFSRSLYYGGPACEGEPCAYCDECKAFVEGEFQGFTEEGR